MNKYEVNGTVKSVGETMTVGQNGFTKRTVVVETGDKYPCPLPFTLKKDNVSKADNLNEGDMVCVKFSLDGREWNGPNGLRYFVDLTCWEIVVTEKAQAATVPSGDGATAEAFKAAVEGMQGMRNAPADRIKAECRAIAAKVFPGRDLGSFGPAEWEACINHINGSAAEASDPDDLPF